MPFGQLTPFYQLTPIYYICSMEYMTVVRIWKLFEYVCSFTTVHGTSLL